MLQKKAKRCKNKILWLGVGQRTHILVINILNNVKYNAQVLAGPWSSHVTNTGVASGLSGCSCGVATEVCDVHGHHHFMESHFTVSQQVQGPTLSVSRLCSFGFSSKGVLCERVLHCPGDLYLLPVHLRTLHEEHLLYLSVLLVEVV